MRITKSSHLFSRLVSYAGVFCLFLIFSGTLGRISAQSLGTFDRDSVRSMLDAVKDDLKHNYYDPNLRGLNLDERLKLAEDQIKQATTRDQLIVTVAQILLDLNDSHTFFLPPSRAARVEYGWQMQMVGEMCYVTAVKPKSDAEAKGLKP